MGDRMHAAALIAAMGLATAAAVAADDGSARLRELEARLASLEARQQVDSADLAAAASAVLRDAERRSTLLANTGDTAAGYDDGFFIRSGAFEFRPSVAFVFRNNTSWVDEGNSSDGDWDNGFEVRRVEFEFEGTVLSPNLFYALVIKTPSDGSPFLDEAFIVYRFEGTPWAIKAGQFKDFVYHEETVSFKRQLAAEKSLLNNVLIGGCFELVQGVALLYDRDALRMQTSFHDGAGSLNTPYLDSPGVVAAHENFGISGRAEWKLAGEWKAYKDFSARDTREDLLVLGAGADWTQGDFADGAADAEGGDRVFPALDMQWELAGPKIGVFAALVGDWTRFNDSAVGDDRLNWGTLIQAGWAITPQWEIFARHDMIRLDDDFRPAGSEDTFHEITAGVNWFLGPNGSAGHRAKITLDVGYLPNGSPVRATGIGIPVATDEDIVYVRAQLLLVI